jgi:energy-converting hydrogenase Eha subunit G
LSPDRDTGRLSGPQEWGWYLFAGVTYIAAGIWQKGLLNWFVGPAWLVVVIVVGPPLLDRLRGRGGDGDAHGRHAR